MKPRAPHFPFALLLALAAGLTALIGAIPYAGSWFDGGRLATVECLVDYHTWQIDGSIFLGPDGPRSTPPDSPYTPDWMPNVLHGTQDKAFINGHFYSDKSPVVSLLMAASYQILQSTTGLVAVDHPHIFCYLMALIWGGGAYFLAVLGMDRFVARAGLPNFVRILLSLGFAFGTVALTYSRQVNNGILLLADFMALYLLLAPSAEPGWGKFTVRQLCAIGGLIGLGYAIDLGVGPVLVLSVTAYIAARTKSWRCVILVLAASFPWFALHHALNYMICGTFKPVGSTPAFFLWPGSHWVAEKLTGVGWAHSDLGDYFRYNVKLLISQRGFIVHNYSLLLALPGAIWLGRKPGQGPALLYCSLALIAGTILLYGATSNNFSGQSCSIRWFVPLLVPFYHVLILLLQRYPALWPDLAILTGFSLLLQNLLWRIGPWTPPLGPKIWVMLAVVLFSWFTLRLFLFFARPKLRPSP